MLMFQWIFTAPLILHHDDHFPSPLLVGAVAVTQCHEDETEAAALAAQGPVGLGQGPVFTFPLTEEAQDERAPLHVQTHTIYSTHTCTVTDLRCIKQPVTKPRRLEPFYYIINIPSCLSG